MPFYFGVLTGRQFKDFLFCKNNFMFHCDAKFQICLGEPDANLP